MGVYQPLGWMIHEVQYLVWGMNPFWYHLASVLFHAANALGLWALTLMLLDRVDRASGLPGRDRCASSLASACAVAVFAVHPLRVEAVAWASCQTYLPSILFAILSVMAYLRACDDGPSAPRPGWLVGAWVLFAVALLTKVAVVSLPFVLLILDVYPLRRVGPGRWFGRAARRVYLEKLAFVALAVPFMVAAVQARWPAESRPEVGVSDLAPRLMQSVYGLWFYPIKTVFPYKVSAYYPLPARVEDYYRGPFVAAALATAAAFVAAFFLRKRSPGLVAALACYLVCLTPSLGIIRTTHNIAANRYCYVASMSGVVVLAYGLRRLSARPRLWRLATALVAGLVVGLSAMTWRQCLAWHSMDALWAQAGFDGTEHYQTNLKLGLAR
ncbi:MAG: hypothetical protein LC745_13225, partial [Planctomycetia bacterium]|nr:hypothetical protein [Planctomycetia bacterium]